MRALLGEGPQGRESEILPKALSSRTNRYGAVIMFTSLSPYNLGLSQQAGLLNQLRHDDSVPFFLNNVAQPPLDSTNFGLIERLSSRVQDEIYQDGNSRIERDAKILVRMRIRNSKNCNDRLRSSAASNTTPAPSYEVELTFETKDEKGRPVRFGSVGGGGRYDGLVSRFMGQPVPATGFSIGVSRLQAALAALGKLGNKAAPGPVVVTVFPGTDIADSQKFVATAAQRRHPRRIVSRQSQARRRPATQICRPARQPLRGHPRSRRKGARTKCRSRT